MYRIKICKVADGRVLFAVDDPNGDPLILWRELLSREFAVEMAPTVGVGGGMTAGPSNDNREGKTLRAAHAAIPSPPWRESLADMGLTARESNERTSGHHVRIMQDGKCVAQWWPSKGTTLDERQQRGPFCANGEDLVAWLDVT